MWGRGSNIASFMLAMILAAPAALFGVYLEAVIVMTIPAAGIVYFGSKS